MFALVVNPAAGNGRSLRMLPEIEALLRQENIQYRVEHTTRPGEATILASKACADGCEAIVSVGGDGTLLEAASGMLYKNIPLLIAPCGTGNDFIRALRLPADPLDCLKAQLHAPEFSVDAGRMNQLYFLNVSGTGLDVEVLRETEKYKRRFKGLFPYLLGVFDAVRHYKPIEATVRFDGEAEQTVRFSVLSIGNGRYIGGGMRAVPNALVNDGLFDVVVVKPVKKWQIFFLFFLYFLGLHTRVGLGETHQCRKLSISRQDTTFNLDGELHRCDFGEYELLPGAITLRIPDPYRKA